MARRKRGFFAEMQHQRELKERDRKRATAEQERLAKQAEREHERAARAQQRADAQAAREQRDRHIEDQRADAASRTRAVNARAADLDSILIDSAARQVVISFDDLRKTYQPRQFNPDKTLATPRASPTWEEYAPPTPKGVARFRKRDRDQAIEAARARYDDALVAHEEAEATRKARLADAETEHSVLEDSRREGIEQHNEHVAMLEGGVANGTPSAVEDYVQIHVEPSRLPDEVPVDSEVAYDPDARAVRVNRDLPPVEIIPDVREFAYVRTRDEITSKARPQKEIRQRYASLIAQVVLQTMRDVLAVQPRDLIVEVAVNGFVSTTNKATGQPERPCLVSVSATREQFDALVLTELDPSSCLRHLNALVSPHPWDLEAIRPIFDPDLSKYRIVDAHDAAARLDARPVLLEMHPTEFEVLIRQLFEAMGMQSWVTQASRDDGVDGIAVNEDPIMGGTCVIQAKRYQSVVGADAVRALAGVMDDKRASRGVLVTTSWYGKATHDFAARNGRIQLIQGEHLKHLLAEHLGLDVTIGELKRRPPRGSTTSNGPEATGDT